MPQVLPRLPSPHPRALGAATRNVAEVAAAEAAAAEAAAAVEAAVEAAAAPPFRLPSLRPMVAVGRVASPLGVDLPLLAVALLLFSLPPIVPRLSRLTRLQTALPMAVSQRNLIACSMRSSVATDKLRSRVRS